MLLSLLIWLLVYYRVPETKGKDFKELTMLFENRVPARDFATYSVKNPKRGLYVNRHIYCARLLPHRPCTKRGLSPIHSMFLCSFMMSLVCLHILCTQMYSTSNDRHGLDKSNQSRDWPNDSRKSFILSEVGGYVATCPQLLQALPWLITGCKAYKRSAMDLQVYNMIIIHIHTT